MNTIHDWAVRHNLPASALQELVQMLTYTPDGPTGKSEAAVQNEIRLAAARRNITLWRNNVGAYETPEGQWVRYGLNNDSAQANKRMKSADLIGIHRGTGRFVSIEVKRPSWKHSEASERDRAQLAWAVTINALGGVALRATSAAAIEEIKL
jgi:hypothetical protein